MQQSPPPFDEYLIGTPDRSTAPRILGGRLGEYSSGGVLDLGRGSEVGTRNRQGSRRRNRWRCSHDLVSVDASAAGTVNVRVVCGRGRNPTFRRLRPERGVRDDRPGLDICLRACGRATCSSSGSSIAPGPQPRPSGQHRALSARGVGLRVLAGQGAQTNTTTAAGRLVFGIFAALAEFRAGAEPECLDRNAGRSPALGQ